MKITAAWILAIVCAALPGLLLQFAIPNKRSVNQTTRDGIYSLAQADRGERVYRDSCISCHNAMMKGTRLTGGKFLAGWDGEKLDRLFQKIQRDMPGDAPGSLNEAAYVDVVTYLLRINKLPPSASSNFSKAHRELTLAQLPNIEFAGYEDLNAAGIEVQVAGCLGKRTTTSWPLEKTTELMRFGRPSTPQGPPGSNRLEKITIQMIFDSRIRVIKEMRLEELRAQGLRNGELRVGDLRPGSKVTVVGLLRKELLPGHFEYRMNVTFIRVMQASCTG